MQLLELREYTQRRGWATAAEYVDTGWSGAKASRPELDRLMRDANLRCRVGLEAGPVGRSVAHSIKSIQELIAPGIRFLAVTQNIDTDENNPMSRFLLHIFAAFGELEREMIRERVTSGIRAAKANGQKLGRPRRVFRRDAAIAMREAGMSWRKIAAELNVPMATVIDACRGE
jgi:DNA invertase Pin-like site-specific DNA recombinase